MLTLQKKFNITTSLDFVNTVSWRESTAVKEHIPSYIDLLEWGHKQGIVDKQEYENAIGDASTSPAEAAAVHHMALELREDLYMIFSALIDGRDPDVDAMARFNETLSEALSHLKLIRGESGYELSIRDEQRLEVVPWRVAVSAADLITSEKFDRVKRCASEGCNWLFLDMSKNRSRRWCDMSNCGNIMKARRYYARIRTSK